jgi:hypothetical protein
VIGRHGIAEQEIERSRAGVDGKAEINAAEPKIRKRFRGCRRPRDSGVPNGLANELAHRMLLPTSESVAASAAVENDAAMNIAVGKESA